MYIVHMFFSWVILIIKNIFHSIEFVLTIFEKKFLKKKFFFSNVPNDDGYVEARNTLINEVISKNLLDFSKKCPLPYRYGKTFDERVIELPWFFSQVKNLYRGRKLNLLDAGSACNHRFYLEHLKEYTDITIMTLAPEKHNSNNLFISYTYGDLREVPFKDNLFDIIVSISTLEHIGLDNSFYLSNMIESKCDDVFLCIDEIKRVLKPGGFFYFTVPFGKYINYGWFQQFDLNLLERCRERFSPISYIEEFFLYDNGWHYSSAKECKYAQYTENFFQGGQAAAGAVACCMWKKHE